MTEKPTYEELEHRVKELEKETIRRKLAEEALQEKAEKLLIAQKVAKMGFLDWNLKTNEMNWSEEVYSIYGIDPQRQPSEIDLTMELVHPDDLEYVKKNLDMAIRGIKEYNIHHRKLPSDGEVIWVHARGELVRDADGNPEILLGTVVDITERKQAEEALEKAHDELELKVAERTDELFKANEKLKQEITERKRAEEALKESEEKYRTITEYANEGIAIAQDNLFKYVNPKICEINGYSKEELINSTFISHVHPDDRNMLIERFKRRTSGEQIENVYDFRIMTKNQEIKWLQVKPVLISWEEKPATLNFLSDITERRRVADALRKAHVEMEQRVAERTTELSKANLDLKREIEEHRKTADELRRSEKKYINLIERANDGILITRDAHVKFVNQRFADLLGYAREEMTGAPQIRYVHPDLVSKSIERTRRHKVDVPVEARHENILRHKGGADIYVEVNAIAIVFEGKMSNLVFVRDITARKKAEQALKESELKYASLVEQSLDGIFILQDGMYKFVNEAYGKTLGYTVDELLGRPFLEVVAPESKEMMAERYSLRISGDIKMPRRYDAKMLRRDGTIAEVEVSAERFQYQGKAAILGFIHDITVRKQFEEVLKKNEQELRRLANKLITAQETERQRLARELHDDITQRLAILSIEAGKMEQQLSTPPDGFFDSFRRMQDELVNLSSDIHAISRRLHPSILEDLGLSDAIKSEAEAIIKREGIAINYEAESIPPDLPKDVALCLYRILQEGIRNIIKHAGATEVNIYLSCHKKAICLSISDNGQGFDLNRIGKKPGLGLASMEERIRFVGGYFNIRSKLGEGTRIEASAPIKQVSM